MRRLLTIMCVLLLPCGTLFSQKKDTYRVRTVVIDPGHGGNKPGALGSRAKEKDIVLAVALKFGKLIEDNYPDVKVVYTRKNDVDISLAERAHIANRNKADLFVSVHANSHPTSSPTGVETYVMGLSESRANLEVAKKENADILLEADYQSNSDYNGFDPNAPETYVMLTMFQNAFIDKSLNFAQNIQTEYKRNIKTINRGVKQAELYVLYKTSMPSVLTEIGFISNPTEERYMMSDEGQATIAVCLFNAFANYKATEEGTDRIVNPVINLKGYKSPNAAKPDTVRDARPQVAERSEVEELEPVVVEEVKEEIRQEARPVTTPQTRPTPTVALPPAQKPKVEPKAEAKPEPVVEKKVEPKVEPKPKPKVEPKPEPKVEPKQEKKTAEPKVEREALRQPRNSAPGAASFFTVQFLTSANLYEAGAAELDGITDFLTFKQGNKYGYITGRFATAKEASEYCEHLKRATSFKDAWSYRFKGTVQQRGTAAQEQKKEEQTKPQTKAQQPSATDKSVKGLTYRVQLCTLRQPTKTTAPEFKGLPDVRMVKAGRLYFYTSGDYATMQEATQKCQAIQKTTSFKDAIVVPYHNGREISNERAKQLLNSQGK